MVKLSESIFHKLSFEMPLCPECGIDCGGHDTTTTTLNGDGVCSDCVRGYHGNCTCPYCSCCYGNH